jgi:large subunit ribosomal protein L29
MAILRSKEIREMKEEDVQKKLNDLKNELMKFRSQVAQGVNLEKPGRVKAIKRTIARILTIRKSKEVK